MDLTSILTVPGEFLVALWNPADFAAQSEARADLAVSLGIAFWVFLLAFLRLTWRRWRPGAKAVAREVPLLADTGNRFVARQIAPRWRSITAAWTWRPVWSVVWRAEAAHLAVYALAPLVLQMARGALFVMFLPFSVMGFGERTADDDTYYHLQRPACWTFLSWCPSPSAQFRGLNAAEEAACKRGGKCPSPPIVYSDPWQDIWKLAWAVIAILWIVSWRIRRKVPPGRH